MRRNARLCSRPARAGSVPYLSPEFTAGGERLRAVVKAYADKFRVQNGFDTGQRKRAAQLILDEKGDAMKFQALVSQQLKENFRIASDNADKAQTSMESQQTRVARAERAFQAGLAAWKKKQEQEAAMAIAGSVFSFFSGIASSRGQPGGRGRRGRCDPRSATRPRSSPT